MNWAMKFCFIHHICLTSCQLTTKHLDFWQGKRFHNQQEAENAFQEFVKSQGMDFYAAVNWFQIGKGVHQGCILSPCLFNLHAKYIMQNSGLNEAQAEIKIAGRNINNFRHADDTTLMAESNELKSFLIKVKEESQKVGLKQHSEK